MTADEIVARTDPGAPARLSGEDLESILGRADSLWEDPTGIAGPIRTIGLGELTLVQESTPDGEVFLRRFGSPESARRFVDARLAAYERMWDG